MTHLKELIERVAIVGVQNIDFYFFFIRLLCIYINSGARELGNTHVKLQNLINQKSIFSKLRQY